MIKIEDVLCCPECKNDIQFLKKDTLICISCRREYAMREGIFILMVGDSIQEEEKKMRENIAMQHAYKSAEEILDIVIKHHFIPVMSLRAEDFRARFSHSDWILDVGSGTGYYWRNIRGGAKLILLDFAFHNLKAAKKLLAGQDNIIYVQADATKLPIKPKMISGVWSVQTTQHFPDKVMDSFLKELRRIIKDKFLVEIYNLNKPFFHKLLYKLSGKKFHEKGKLPGMFLSRFNSGELSLHWSNLTQGAKITIGYSELFFHPDLHFMPQGNFVLFLENIGNRFSFLTKFFARQIQVTISK